MWIVSCFIFIEVEKLSKKQLIAIIEEQARQLKEQAALIQKQAEKIEQLTMENRLLRQKVDSLVRKVFGASSEKLDPNQLDLFLNQPESAPGKEMASCEIAALDKQEANPHAPQKQTPRKERYPEDLPVIEEVLDPEEVKEAPAQWRCIGQEISEQLNRRQKPGQVLLILPLGGKRGKNGNAPASSRSVGARIFPRIEPWQSSAGSISQAGGVWGISGVDF